MSETALAQQYATFTVGAHALCVDVLEVQEVLRDQALTPVPLAPAIVAGLLNVRGQIVLGLDMRRALRLAPRAADEGPAPVSVLVRGPEGVVSLQVDEIGDVVELDGSTFESPPSHLGSSLGGMIQGVHKLAAGLVLVLDTRALLDAGSREQ